MVRKGHKCYHRYDISDHAHRDILIIIYSPNAKFCRETTNIFRENQNKDEAHNITNTSYFLGINNHLFNISNMTAIPKDSQASSFLWGEVELSASLSAKFSDVFNDDFHMVDGLMDDFTEFFDIDTTDILGKTSSMIDDSMIDFSSKGGNDEEKKEEVRGKEKVRKVREDRSRSPAPKRRRYDTAPNPHTPPSQKSIEDLQERCKLALQQLALSMRRSEMTRSEIASFQKTCGTRAKLQGALLAHNPEAPFLWTVYGMKKP